MPSPHDLLGKPAPAWSGPNQRGETLRLEDYRGSWLVLYFYPKDDTPGCTAEACAFRDDIETLRGLSARVVGVSRDSVTSHARFAEDRRLPFDLLSDRSGDVARRYGARGFLGITKRVTFLIAPDGTVAEAWERVSVRGHAEDVRAAIARRAGAA